MFPEVATAIRDAIRWRYRLIPTLASLYFNAALGTRLPVTRPLMLHFATDKCKRSREESFEFLLGSSLLVAPVMKPNQTTRVVYLPGGNKTKWCHLQSGMWYDGGAEYTVRAPNAFLEEEKGNIDNAGCPMFLRGGGGLVLSGSDFDGWKHTSADEREIIIAAPLQNGSSHLSFSWFEEDGESNQYLNGAWAKITVCADLSDREVLITSVSAKHGGIPFSLPFTKILISLPKGDERVLKVGEQSVSVGQSIFVEVNYE
eukprot:g4619.t1